MKLSSLAQGSKFQTVMLLVFVFLGIVGVLMFAGIIPTPRGTGLGGGDEPAVPITMWGTLPSSVVSVPIKGFTERYKDQYRLTYVEKQPAGLEVELLRAVAEGRGPDLVLFPHDRLLDIEDRLYVIPDATFTRRNFLDQFSEGGEIFSVSEGALALPLAVDPVVLYWNRDILNDNRITEPPRTWSGVIDFARRVTVRGARNVVERSAIPLGEANNVTHIKDVLSALIMQTGDAIVSRSAAPERPGALHVVLGDAVGSAAGRSGAASVLSYFVGFADPVKPYYSWNTSFSPSFDTFAAGDAALYVGLASDYARLAERNPHLNFDVARIPQLEASPRDLTFARHYGIGLLKTAPSFEQAFNALFLLALSEAEFQRAFAAAAGLAPARRALLAGRQTDPVAAVVYDQALIGRAWLDPDPERTDAIFIDMVNRVRSRIAAESESVNTAAREMESLLGN